LTAAGSGVVHASMPRLFLWPLVWVLALVVPLSALAVDPPPDRSNVRYGPYYRNVLDFWQAKSAQPTPLFVYIHGGGWYQGDKAAATSDIVRLHIDLISFMLRHGVSVASINYRYATIAPLPAPVLDAARAVQFLRAQAGSWHLDPRRVAAMGTSAGGCTALWLAYHPDLADPRSPDPVARQSTRLSGVLAWNPQTSIDPPVITGWVGPQVLNHPMIWLAVGARDRDDALARYAAFQGLYREYSPINHVAAGAPPVLLVYGTGPLPAATPDLAIHHMAFGSKLKAKAEAVGAVCILRLTNRPDPTQPQPYDFVLKVLDSP